MSEDYKELCRLCLEPNPEFSIYEDRISTKIGILLTVEIDPECPEFPTKICLKCRISLEKLYIFRIQSLDVDTKLREAIYGSENTKERCDEAISFLKQYDTSQEHDYGTEKRLPQLTTSDEEYASIEKTVQQALHQNNYFGDFVLKIEEIEGNGLRKVRVIKDNGANIIMKIRMPDSFLQKKKKIISKQESLNKILEKCENIETTQQKITQSIKKTENFVTNIHSWVQSQKTDCDGIEFIDAEAENDEPKDPNAPFELPINSLSELWRLNMRIKDPEVRAAMDLELLKVEPHPGMRIIGRVLRAVIDNEMLGKLCWSGKIKIEHKYLKLEEKIMLSKMKNLVDYLLDVCQSKEGTPISVFHATVMNIIRKARAKRGKNEDANYSDVAEYQGQYLNEEDFLNDADEID
ncbi:uncharacterized protein LOC134835074 [Culicoides brevitarsis]|uniref:uncharacterized protein LOC134835074 n=1 Tax=Culicoides brevitarsis TaxID=469753 RepID=UPI00307C3A37